MPDNDNLVYDYGNHVYLDELRDIYGTTATTVAEGNVTVTAGDITIDPQTVTATNWAVPVSVSSYIATQDDLDQLSRKIYKIISEHTRIDISEEEFMEILKE